MNNHYDFIIIGGGISGLYIINHLLQNYKNKKICLLERSSFTGGKIRTLYDNKGNVILEKGPWRIHNSHKRCIDLVEKLGLEITQNSSSQKSSQKFNYDICKKKKKFFI